jgi:hypothetical protein
VHLAIKGLVWIVGRIAASTKTTKSTAPPNGEPVSADKPEPLVGLQTPRPEPQGANCLVSDRAVAAVINGVNYRFYLYRAIGQIHRVNRDTREPLQVFTPELAAQSRVPFSLDGAVAYTRLELAEHHAPASNADQFQAPAFDAPVFDAPAPAAADLWEGFTEPTLATAPPPPVSAPLKRVLTPEQRKNSYTGTFLWAGHKKYTPEDGRSYTSYTVIVRNQFGFEEKSWRGVELQALIDDHKVQKGDIITLTPLGKQDVIVQENGKDKTTKKNVFDLQIIERAAKKAA